jgi:hypothetical protein
LPRYACGAVLEIGGEGLEEADTGTRKYFPTLYVFH